MILWACTVGYLEVLYRQYGNVMNSSMNLWKAVELCLSVQVAVLVTKFWLNLLGQQYWSLLL